jgi:hypothetical protein
MAQLFGRQRQLTLSQDANSFLRGAVVKSSSAVSQPSNQQQVILKDDPQFYKPISAVQTPEGGSMWLFLLAAMVTLGWAVMRRNADREAGFLSRG